MKNLLAALCLSATCSLAWAVPTDKPDALVKALTEDVLEVLVGDIQDEYDLEEDLLFRELAPGRFLIDGSASIRTVNRKFNLRLSEKHVNTLAGFILFTMGTIPKEGDLCTYEKTTFKVVKVADRRIETIEMVLSGKE